MGADRDIITVRATVPVTVRRKGDALFGTSTMIRGMFVAAHDLDELRIGAQSVIAGLTKAHIAHPPPAGDARLEKLKAALRAAREYVAQERCDLLGSCCPKDGGGKPIIEEIDPDNKLALERDDRVLAQIDEALAQFQAQPKEPL